MKSFGSLFPFLGFGFWWIKLHLGLHLSKCTLDLQITQHVPLEGCTLESSPKHISAFPNQQGKKM